MSRTLKSSISPVSIHHKVDTLLRIIPRRCTLRLTNDFLVRARQGAQIWLASLLDSDRTKPIFKAREGGHDMKRFIALDSWRGICACLVCLYHFKDTAFGNKYPQIMNNFYLYVDFFFVLSGFIIAYNYQSKLSDGFNVFGFMFLRLGRVYPLHIFMLVTIITYTAIGGGEELPHSSGLSVLTNLLLIHSLGIHDTLTWNCPSWSISVEFYTYALFAMALVVCREMMKPVVLILALLISPALLFMFGSHSIAVAHDFGLIRCIYGFSIGVLCCNLYKKYFCVEKAGLPAIVATILEVAAVSVMATFIAFSSQGVVTLATPLIFALVVMVFAIQRGFISKLLSCSPMAFVGSVSYSIYMVHMFIQHCIRDLGYLLDSLFPTQIFTYVYVDGRRALFLGTELWQGAIACVMMLLCVITVSCLTHRLIEMPGQTWSRRMAEKFKGSKTMARASLPGRSVAGTTHGWRWVAGSAAGAD
jgi:peptidoglycan/LPS O-acetylase OafA/YrhL